MSTVCVKCELGTCEYTLKYTRTSFTRTRKIGTCTRVALLAIGTVVIVTSNYIENYIEKVIKIIIYFI